MLRLSTTALVMLRLSCPDRVEPAGAAKVIIWRKVDPARRVTLPTGGGGGGGLTPLAEQQSRMLRLSTTALGKLRLSCLDRVDPSGGAKVFIWRKVSPARRLRLPSQKGDPAIL